MIIVTGAAGFIGSNIIKGLNAKGISDILAIDDLTNGRKFINLSGLQIVDYMDKDDFLTEIKNSNGELGQKIQAILHQGACSTTTEWDGRYMMKNNYEYSKELLHYCMDNNISFIYASSAAVYGTSTEFTETLDNEKPINVYGYSKWQFDQYVRKMHDFINNQVVGLRYFNVYGPREQHKGSMASVVFHMMNQLKDSSVVKLFEGCDGYGHGEQLRDFVYVDDIVKVNLWFLENNDKAGLFNVGTGSARTFNDAAKTLCELNNKGKIEYVPFPEKLKGCYQSFTQADLSSLREIGYEDEFTPIEEGIKKYYEQYFKFSS